MEKKKVRIKNNDLGPFQLRINYIPLNTCVKGKIIYFSIDGYLANFHLGAGNQIFKWKLQLPVCTCSLT